MRRSLSSTTVLISLLSLLVMTPSSARTIRLGAVSRLGAEEEESSTIKSGLTVTRGIQKAPGLFQLGFGPGDCDSRDLFGDNDCYFEWNQDVTGAVMVMIDEPIEEGDTMEAHIKIYDKISYSITCPLCGKDCVLSLPIFKISYTIPLPPCPIPVPTLATPFEISLPPSSPLEGIPAHLEGHVKIFKGSTREEIADVMLSVDVK